MRKLTESGQTVIALLIFMMLAIVLTTTAAAVTAINTRSNTSFIAGERARQNAEAGIENAMQMLLRNPNYTGGSMTFTDGTATISVSGTTAKTIVSQGINGNFRRTVTATVTYASNNFTLNTWSETP